MNTIICKRPGSLELTESPVPDLLEGEVLLKPKRIGICGTDFHAFTGKQPFFSYPRILGHELSAEILSVKDSATTDLLPGDEVVVVPYRNCGDCYACRQGMSNCCINLKVLGIHEDGGMRTTFSWPAHLLLKDDRLNADQKAIIEPLSIGFHAVQRAGVDAGKWVVISGCGPIGVAVLAAAVAAKANIIAIDVEASRLEFCRQQFNVEHLFLANENTMEWIRELTGGDMAQYAFDATGFQEPMEKAVDYLGPGGKYILVGLNRGHLRFLHPSIHAREISIYCSRNATINDFKGVMNHLANQHFPLDAYVTHRQNWQEIPNHFEEWKNNPAGVMKVLTHWD